MRARKERNGEKVRRRWGKTDNRQKLRDWGAVKLRGKLWRPAEKNETDKQLSEKILAVSLNIDNRILGTYIYDISYYLKK